MFFSHRFNSSFDSTIPSKIHTHRPYPKKTTTSALWRARHRVASTGTGSFQDPQLWQSEIDVWQTSKAIEFLSFPNRINVWYIYLHLVVFLMANLGIPYIIHWSSQFRYFSRKTASLPGNVQKRHLKMDGEGYSHKLETIIFRCYGSFPGEYIVIDSCFCLFLLKSAPFCGI